MSSESTTVRNRKQNWAVTLLPLLAALTLVIFGRVDLLENSFYDQLQRMQYTVPNDEIVLLTVNPRLDDQTNIWTAEGLLPLAERLHKAGAKYIVSTQTLRFPSIVTLEQIRALEKIESSNSETTSLNFNPMAKNVDYLRATYQNRKSLVKRFNNLNNFFMAASITDNLSSADNHARTCDRHLLQAGNDNNLTTVRHVSLPEADVCAAMRGIGYNSFWADDDGIVRHSDLLLSASGTWYPSLTTAIASTYHGMKTPEADANGQVMLDRNPIKPRPLNRYHDDSGDSGYRSIGYNEALLSDTDLSFIKNRIVLIGEAGYAGIPGYGTPTDRNMSPLQLTATSLSNLLTNSFYERPQWLTAIENLTLVVLISASLLLLPRMPWFPALLVGVSAGAILLGVEAWLLKEHNLWVQLVTTSVFVTLTVFLITVFRGVNYTRRSSKNMSMKTLMAQSSTDSLDLEFSVLRQKNPNAIVKRKIYDIADQYAQTREFAKAEQALTYLADVDPDYMDVGEKLHRISGNKQRKPEPPKESPVLRKSGNKKLGRYEITKVLGRGAMSTVYLGVDPAIQRKVAIKTIALADEFDDKQLDKARQQFVREAESAGRLNHPDIVGIYDIGDDANIAYLAMEYFSGTPLIEYADRSKLMKPVKVLQLIARAADALDYAHGQNVVHRDVKPANIMYDAATDRLKITDFGIARLTDTSRTKTGVILGTPSYMSPEQLSASGVTGQSDLYSLGVTLFHLLTGEPPFRADSIPQLMDKIVHEIPQPVSALRSDLPECIDVIVKKTLAKNPQDRYQNGKAMARALLACCEQFKHK